MKLKLNIELNDEKYSVNAIKNDNKYDNPDNKLSNNDTVKLIVNTNAAGLAILRLSRK